MSINRITFRELLPPEDATKIGRLLHRLACGETFNRFEAEVQLHDHAVNSTVSRLANDYGVKITRTPETVPGYQGKPTRCVRYALEPHSGNLTGAYWLLGLWGYRLPQRTLFDPPPPEAA